MWHAKDDIPWEHYYTWHYTMVVTMIKKGSTRLPFANLDATKVDDMGNGIVLWREKDLVTI
jgi:hypothetical protein